MEEVLSFAKAYMVSAIKLTHTHKQVLPSKIFLDYSKSNILCAHFLMAHGVELYLKFLILSLGGKPKTDASSHTFQNLLKQLAPLWHQYYKRDLFNKKQRDFIGYLDRSIKFRYPTDQNWSVIPEIFIEANTWNDTRIDDLKEKCCEILERLHEKGYRLNKQIKIIVDSSLEK